MHRMVSWLLAGVGLAIVAVAPSQSRAVTPNLTTLVSFCSLPNCTDGANPQAGLIADASGNLFGTTSRGVADQGECGSPGCGTAFDIVKTATGYASTPTTLVSLNNNEFGPPTLAGLIADANGNLFGTTAGGGANGYGTVFEIAKTAGGYASNPTTLVSFCSQANCTDGAFPLAGLIADADGNLFGTTSEGGNGYGTTAVTGTTAGAGTVFEIVKTATGYASTPTTLVRFCSQANCTDGADPTASLIADSNGNLFGTTVYGGANGAGTVFQIAKTASGYASTPTTLVSFDSTNGAEPHAGLIADANGSLFGTTAYGGASGYGTVFEIAKTAGGYASAPTTLASFGIASGIPFAGLMADANGNLFGTTSGNPTTGPIGLGTVFEIVKTAGGYASTPSTLISFSGTNGRAPYGGLIADASGNLFGTTSEGGAYNAGTVFEITGSGFVVPVVVPPSEVATSASGLAYSRVSHTFNGTLTITNISSSPIIGPFSILLTGLTAGVTLANATGNFSGSSYLAVPAVASLAAGQGATVGVQFDNPSYGVINFTPAIYSGSL